MATKKVAHKRLGTHLFIDTNVLLGFFSYSKDDLQELEKLVKIVKAKAVKLYVTEQVVDEFSRNRDAKLAESFTQFRPVGPSGCPSFMRSLPEFEPFREAQNVYQNALSSLAERARKQAEARELLADRLFKKIVDQAVVIPVSDAAYAAAERRFLRGNPPGKSATTVGDELNWELLLAKVPKKSDLHLVTKDSDFASKLNAGQPKLFLSDEWENVNGGKLYLHEQISLFFKVNYPDEDFSLEIEKRESIDALVGSKAFASTHVAVAQLEPYIPFLTKEEAEEVIQGGLSNSQVAWIASDSDVHSFLSKMLDEHGDDLSSTQLKRLKDALGLNSEDVAVEPAETILVDEDEIPF